MCTRSSNNFGEISNIVVKVADFGLAKVRPDPKKEEKLSDTFIMTGETGCVRRYPVKRICLDHVALVSDKFYVLSYIIYCESVSSTEAIGK